MNTPDQNERLAATQRQMAYIKSELNGSVNSIRIRDNAVLLIEVLEYLFFGRASSGDPNFIPGTPASSLEDTRATRVEFTSGPGAVAAAENLRQRQMSASQPFSPTMPAFAQPPAPAEPVRNGDTQFVRTAPPSAAVTFGATAPNGQRTEYFDAQGRPVDHLGRLIDANGNPLQAPAPYTPPMPETAEMAAAVPTAGPFAAFGIRTPVPTPPAAPVAAPPYVPREEMAAVNPIPLME